MLVIEVSPPREGLHILREEHPPTLQSLPGSRPVGALGVSRKPRAKVAACG